MQYNKISNKIVYLSCNPATLARDLETFKMFYNIDGCFYRVKDIEDDETISTERLTLQGTGGGGGTGGGSGGSWSFQISGGKAKTYASTATKMEITFKANYSGTDENALASVAFKLKDASEPFYTLDKTMAFNVEHTIDIFKYKHLFGTSKTTVVMYLYDIYGAERSVNLTIQIATLEISSTRKSLLYSMTDTYSYDFTLTGTVDGIEERKAVYELYTENNILTPVTSWEEVIDLDTDIKDVNTIIDCKFLDHAVYILKVQAFAKIAVPAQPLNENS